MHYIPILSTIVSFAFAGAVLNRYRYKYGKHLLFWGLGLVWYGIGTMTEVVAAFTFSPLVVKLWYLSGAMLTAAWLGQGTAFLLIRKRGVAQMMAWGLIAVSALAAVLVLSTPVNAAAAAAYDVTGSLSSQYHDILGRSGLMLFLTIVLNIYGTVLLVGGAVYSAYIFWRKRVLLQRVYGNVLIAAGALMPAMAGSLVKAGLVDWLYISELLGAVIMYVGFLQATSSPPVTEKKPSTIAS